MFLHETIITCTLLNENKDKDLQCNTRLLIGMVFGQYNPALLSTPSAPSGTSLIRKPSCMYLGSTVLSSSMVSYRPWHTFSLSEEPSMFFSRTSPTLNMIFTPVRSRESERSYTTHLGAYALLKRCISNRHPHLHTNIECEKVHQHDIHPLNKMVYWALVSPNTKDSLKNRFCHNWKSGSLEKSKKKILTH